jgi:hypothetical protein
VTATVRPVVGCGGLAVDQCLTAAVPSQYTRGVRGMSSHDAVIY